MGSMRKKINFRKPKFLSEVLFVEFAEYRCVSIFHLAVITIEPSELILKAVSELNAKATKPEVEKPKRNLW